MPNLFLQSFLGNKKLDLKTDKELLELNGLNKELFIPDDIYWVGN
jgi:hypothetical protein